MKRREFCVRSIAGGLSLAGVGLLMGDEAAGDTADASRLPKASFNRLPRWRGFNLLEKFYGQSRPYREDDFRMIRDFGFNFVRLPMDYRVWTVENDWRRFNEKVLEEIDVAIQYGEKYGIHVNLNFHRAPGYTVAKPAEPKSVWTDPEAQEVCRLHWTTFAKRYKGISSDQLSFNLFNEPGRIEGVLDQCIAVHRMLIQAIHAEDPDRLIICDGAEWGNRPFFELVNDKVAQATRGYAPMEVSHYKASWVNSKDFPVPRWPNFRWNGLLLSPGKKEIAEEYRKPLVVNGPFPTQTKLRIKIGSVSSRNEFVVLADGNEIFTHSFQPGPGEGEWKTVVHRPEWDIYQNVYDRDYWTEIPAGTKQVELRLRHGDWLTITELGFQREGSSESVASFFSSWNSAPSVLQCRESPDGFHLSGAVAQDRAWLSDRMQVWRDLESQGVGVLVGEFGAYSGCPHAVALAWMEDMLWNWKQANWGYALWNFRGSFGIADSQRSDVEYEDFHGLKLDRKMLELLQKY